MPSAGVFGWVGVAGVADVAVLAGVWGFWVSWQCLVRQGFWKAFRSDGGLTGRIFGVYYWSSERLGV